MRAELKKDNGARMDKIMFQQEQVEEDITFHYSMIDR